MVENCVLKRSAETILEEQLDGRERAQRLEGAFRQVIQRVASLGEIDLLVLDAGEGECLVALRHVGRLVQVRLWREFVNELVAGQDPGVEQVLERIVA